MVGWGDAGTIGSGLGAGFSIGGGVYSAIAGSEDAARITNIERQKVNTEEQENLVRRNAMELTARRQMTQNVREAQYARSMALSTGTNQGAQFGSGVQGAYGSISGQSNTNMLGISQSMLQGEKMFDLNTQLDKNKIDLAEAQSKMLGDQAFGGMLGSFGKSLGPLGSLVGGLKFD